MTDSSIRPFDASAVYQAVDARRRELELSWKGLADQIWDLSSELPNQRTGHPISPSTLTHMARKPSTSDQHASGSIRLGPSFSPQRFG